MTFLENMTPNVGDHQGMVGYRFDVINGGGRTGDYYFKGGPNWYRRLLFDSKQEAYFRLGIADWANGTDGFIQFRNSSDNVTHIEIQFNSALGLITAERSTSIWLAQSPVGTFSDKTWNTIEVHLKIDDSTGILQVKCNGDLVINYSGDTRNGGSTATIDQLHMQCFNGVYSYYTFDDIAVRDDDWCGAGGIHLILPDSAGDVSDWTASAGNAWETVDERPPNFSDYIYEDSANLEQHLFNFTDIPSGVRLINSVKVLNVAKLSEAGSGSVQSIAKIGSTVASGINYGLDEASNSYVKFIMSENPDTVSGWVSSDITSLQAGVEVV